jgi:hypothetical protein
MQKRLRDFLEANKSFTMEIGDEMLLNNAKLTRDHECYRIVEKRLRKGMKKKNEIESIDKIWLALLLTMYVKGEAYLSNRDFPFEYILLTTLLVSDSRSIISTSGSLLHRVSSSYLISLTE